eukprot:gnl/Chilomastix_cuspidata/5201.p1 GENE.gnl/Chilomastix_cuspidata/5201~~gnl/Chilomastix_cuspidata/5201.p1  ORF type:complete len:265 (+),score=20.08 gnl/Chilomastix_cuspidata/5201:146-940(+)
MSFLSSLRALYTAVRAYAARLARCYKTVTGKPLSQHFTAFKKNPTTSSPAKIPMRYIDPIAGIPTQEQLGNILAVLYDDTPRRRILFGSVALACTTCARMADVFRIRTLDLNLETGFAAFQFTKTESSHEVRIVQHDFFGVSLLDVQGRVKTQATEVRSDYLFFWAGANNIPDPAKRWSSNAFAKAVKSVCKTENETKLDLGSKGFRVHSCRHSAVRDMVPAGVKIEAIRAQGAWVPFGAFYLYLDRMVRRFKPPMEELPSVNR